MDTTTDYIHYDPTSKHYVKKSNGTEEICHCPTVLTVTMYLLKSGVIFSKSLTMLSTEQYIRGLRNRNAVKISYGYLPNMKNIINKHNGMIIMNNRRNQPNSGCFCRIQDPCPLNVECLTIELVHQATVKGMNLRKKKHILFS